MPEIIYPSKDVQLDDMSELAKGRIDTRPPGMYSLLREIATIGSSMTVDERVMRHERIQQQREDSGASLS